LQLGSAQTLHLVVRASILYQQRLVQNVANATISDRLSRACDMRSNNLLQALLMEQGKLFQQSPSKTVLLCPCTDNCYVATLVATTKCSINCNEHLSSVEHCMKKMIEVFGPAHHANASTEVQCQTVEHTLRYAMRCPEWSSKNTSSDPATLLLRPFPNGFLRAVVRLQIGSKNFTAVHSLLLQRSAAMNIAPRNLSFFVHVSCS
jgi:hypothetical protein